MWFQQKKWNVPNTIFFTGTNFYRNLSSSSRVQKKICSGKRKPALCASNIKNQNIPWIMLNYQNFVFCVKKNLWENLLVSLKFKINSSLDWNWSENLIVFSPCLKVYIPYACKTVLLRKQSNSQWFFLPHIKILKIVGNQPVLKLGSALCFNLLLSGCCIYEKVCKLDI